MKQIAALECVFGEGEVAIAQRRLTDGILEAYPCKIIQHNSPLPVLLVGALAPDVNPLQPTPFRSVIGLLAYLFSGSRPDLESTVNYLAHNSIIPTAENWEILDNMVGYLLNTCD
ncbi:hypothetical protein O181_030345 [Austropuccinia psidii MF-1]|uniref:Uncharacterized protein n=1 Tax=Austropuccinia psidii MF-1 TaxID=1389203 RepID=A0A9Q3H653_9BASI|nr:hypothetical protein [Austropuccinia psidii MF-1]